MSLYNMLFGENPAADILLTALGLTRSDVPRYRDVFLINEEDKPRIVIHTRTGGGNRDYYDSEEQYLMTHSEDRNDPERYTGPWNESLRTRSTFVRDEDAEFDSTYANFVFDVPAPFLPLIAIVNDIVGGTFEQPAERWKKLFAALESGTPSDDAKRALEVGKQIKAKLDQLPGGGIVTV